MQRYSSPTNQMTLDPQGSFITLADHEAAMVRTPPSFIDHLHRHSLYEDRACVIVTTFAAEGAISKDMAFGGFSGIVGKGVVRLMLDNLGYNDDHSNQVGVAHIDVPAFLFDTDAMDGVLVAARQHREAVQVKLERERLERNARVEAEERAKARELLLKYPDLKDSEQ